VGAWRFDADQDDFPSEGLAVAGLGVEGGFWGAVEELVVVAVFGEGVRDGLDGSDFLVGCKNALGDFYNQAGSAAWSTRRRSHQPARQRGSAGGLAPSAISGP